MLAEVVPFAASDVGEPALTAVRGLAGLCGAAGCDVTRSSRPWSPGRGRLVFANPELPDGTIDHRAYVLCVLEALHRGLRRRDVYAVGSLRWGDHRAGLLDGHASEQTARKY